jgi:D-beta-D-heptose 7-phosphate kinase / D-beta-D-heptose 1-phosphate adenosyltransferase
VIDQLDNVIQAIEHQWSNMRLLVIGDVMIDKYIRGDVLRISPEAPVPIVKADHTSYQPGGAANVAINLARLGAKVQLIGFTGGDEDERLLLESLRSAGVVPRCTQCAGFPTVSKLRILGARQQMLRVDFERIGPRPVQDQDRLIEAALSALPQSDAIILSDYAKGALNERVCQAVISEARRLEIPILVDPKSADFSIYRGATTICPNFGELSRALRIESGDLEAVFDAAEQSLDKLNVEFITATMSERGIALLRRGDRFQDPAAAREVFDVSGAGDTVIAVLGLSLASKLRPEVGIHLANLAAGVVVGKVGTVPIERHELLAALTPEVGLQAQSKIVSAAELVTRVALWRKQGERVVFTNGCFDLLHIGHITLIEQARRLGDRLIIAINSDASISTLKGPNRPVVGQNERARVLAALGAVDAVVIFEQPTPLQLIVATRPDVLVKGGDYKPETIVGAQEVQSWQGQVRIVPTVKGFSTTRLIEKSAI